MQIEAEGGPGQHRPGGLEVRRTRIFSLRELGDPSKGMEQGMASMRAAEALKKLVESGQGSERYRTDSEIGRGGMGMILKVWDENLNRYLAMKVALGPGAEPSKKASAIDPRMLGRFLEEAQVTGQLDHPGIVPVHELGIDEDCAVYFTMRLVKGRDLRQIFALVQSGEEGWNPTRALGVVLRVCEAMAYAHDKGVIHRDLKPENIMVGRFGEVYVMDWGLARVIGREDIHDIRIKRDQSSAIHLVTDDMPASGSALQTMDGDVVGTPAYMSPEQARGRIADLDGRTDVYAVGAILYHLLSGHPPYVEPSGKTTQLEILQKLLEEPPVPLSKQNPDVQGELDAICTKAMQREQKARYAGMQELAEDLRAYLEGRVVKAYETGALAEFRKWIQRNKALSSASAAALALLVIGLITSSVLFVRAERSATIAEDEKVKVLRLSDVRRLEDLVHEASMLWPAYPDRVPDMQAWLGRAKDLSDRLAGHRQALSELRVKALPRTKEQEQVDREAHPLYSQWKRLDDHYARHLPSHPESAEANKEFDQAQLALHVAGHEAELKDLSQRIDDGLVRYFESPEERWQHDMLSDLTGKIADFARTDTGLVARVRARMEFAQTVAERTLHGEEARSAWERALADIADPVACPAYVGFSLSPQIGLLPIGKDPHSGLWEFAHLQSGEIPERDPDGKLKLGEGTCIVLVLVPGGSFRMGAQSQDPAEPGYDHLAQSNEMPSHEVALDPFFMSKFEMTQGQWQRATGENPSAYKPVSGKRDLQNPVEQVSWNDATRVLSNLGLGLPTEAQWEYAARAGTQTPWWTGAERDSLHGAANLADHTAREGGATWAALAEWPEFDDGSVVHAAVGRYRANSFGLHEIHGNVWEWCRDWFGEYAIAVEPGDGLRHVETGQYHVYRGSGFLYGPAAARVSARDFNAPDYRGSGVGLRPARAVEH